VRLSHVNDGPTAQNNSLRSLSANAQQSGCFDSPFPCADVRGAAAAGPDPKLTDERGARACPALNRWDTPMSSTPVIATGFGSVDLTSIPATEPYELSNVFEGDPQSHYVDVATVGETTLGVWQVTEGSFTSTGLDEAFVVLSGAGTLTFVETGTVVELRPGVLVRVTPDATIEWEITSLIRKLYIE